MELDESLQLFIVEARELLEQMENALLRVEQMPDDSDTINAIFRAAHTIKGSAGLFGLDHIVGFTHTAESVLDRVRSGQLAICSELVVVLLGVCDHLGLLITRIAEGTEHDKETQRSSDDLADKLKAWLPEKDQPSSPHPVAPEQETAQTEGVSSENWHISLRFSPDVLRNGMDPLSFIRYLKRIGEISEIVTLIEHIPPLSELDPEACYLGFEISFRTDADKAAIEDVFEFVRDDAHIGILPPHSKITQYQKLIDEMPEEEMLLGEILVRCGTLTRAELEDALNHQGNGQQKPQSPIGQLLMDQKRVHPQVVAAALDKQKRVKEARGTGSDSGSIRVNAVKLDEHINQIGELIIASAGAKLIAQHVSAPDLLEALARLSRLVEEIRDSALSLRMVQIGATFNRFQRVVRDVSAELGKDIRLEILGAETELDKTVVEKITDPLTHLVRNSMDHGIEAAEERLACGKPAFGTITLNAFHDSGSIVIEVSDDGAGLKRERIRAKAIERGLIRADQTLSDQDIDQLIFEPGFSTADQLSNLSGRGVGMDVVRRNIAALRGSIEIASNEGQGTRLRIRLPLTLAIIDGFLVGVGNSCFVIPLDTVVECVELPDAESSENSDHLNLRGEVLPFIRLKQLFAIPDQAPGMDGENSCGDRLGSGPSLLSAEGAAALAADEDLHFLLDPVQRENVVVVQYAGHRAGLVVDRLRGEFQTVIRPLGAMFEGLSGISGFTILGDGRVALILDVPGLVNRVIKSESKRRQNRSIPFTGEGK
ncbi:chemotaxis protein CheW [Niveibacterium terrae]|uniref:chemotaxis protein CheW n=1 Tax=Niveibacterium terrae TaxID=3373598 RepID=UPI003A8E535C